MNAAIAELQSCVDEWVVAKAIPENDWDRMRGLNFQELLRTRSTLVKQLESRICTQCNDFDDHVRYNHAKCLTTAKNILVLDSSRGENTSSKHCQLEDGNFRPELGTHS